MFRRDVLRAAGVGLAALAGGVVGRADAHPGPYRPYGHVAVPGAREAVVSPDGTTAYVAANTGFAVVDVTTPDRPEVLADVRDLLAEREDGPLRAIHDVKLDGDRLLVVGPANPRPNAVSGALVVDVSDPAEPVPGAFYETDYPVHNCDLVDGHAYLTANDGEQNPLVVVDVTGDEPRAVGRWSLASYDDRWERVPAGVRPLHDVVVRDGVAYLAHWDAGTWLLDVSDPTSPTHVTHFAERDPTELQQIADEDVRREATEPPGNSHYVAPNEDGSLVGVGRESWAVEPGGGGPSGIDLWDVSDPSSPTRLATIEPPATPDPTFGGVWTTAHNFELRGDRLYSSWYQGGVKRHDVSDPANPEELTWWRDPRQTRFWTAQLAVPGETFVAPSMGVGEEGEAGLWTFPDHAGQQADPPDVLGEGDRPTPVTAEPTTAPGGGETPAASEREGTETATTSPGLGPGVGALGVGAAAWWLRRRGRGRE
jgi:hypothetical protein